MTLDVGSAYTPSLTVTDINGNPVNPATAALTITLPDQTTQTPAITLPPAQVGLVIPTAPFVPAQAGLHKFAWATTGPTLQKTDYENFRNFASAISLADARLRLGVGSRVRDEQLRLYMGAATREAEKVVGTLVPRVFTNDWVPGTYKDVIRVPHPPILPAGTAAQASVTSLRSAYPQGPSWDVTTQLLVNPEAGTIRHVGLIPWWYGPWLVTYTGGRAEIAEPVVEGVKEILFDLWSATRGLTANLAEAAAQESLIVPPYYRLPAAALALLKSYEMPTFG